MSVKRYDLCGEWDCYIDEKDGGGYVTHSDYAALEAERDRLAEHNRVLAEEVKVAREYNKLRNAPRGSGVLSDWQRRLSRCRAATDASGALARAGQEGGGA